MIYRTFFRMDKFEKVLEKGLKRAEKWGTMDTSGRKWSEVEQSGMESGRPL